jgi:hypothetical protein
MSPVENHAVKLPTEIKSMNRVKTTIRNKKQHRIGNRKLTRYIHSRNYSKLSGYKGMKPVLNIRRNRLAMAIIAIAVIVIGVWFVLK